MNRTLKTTLTAALLLAAGSVQAAGFYIDTQDSRASGMSTAIVGHVNDASALFYNPAGMMEVEGLDVKLGITGIIPRINFTPAAGTPGAGETFNQDFTVSPPPHAYAAVRLRDYLTVGLGVNVPFAARTTWEDGFVGSTQGKISRLAAWHITPAVAVQPHERVRLGAGFNIVRATVHIFRDISLVPVSTAVPEAELGGDSWGFGVRAGLQVDLLPRKLRLGVTYHSQVSLDFEGDGHFEGEPPEFSQRLQDQEVGAQVRLPTIWAFGLAYMPNERFTLAFDVNWVRWSDFPQLFIDFGDNGLQPGTLDNPLPKDWEDQINWHLGAEYRFSEALTGRVGAMIDPTPSPAATLGPDLPDANRYKGSVGVGYRMPWYGLYLEGAYQFLFLADTESTLPALPGDYGGSAHVLSVTLGLRM
jgi:long-chain fatty acid transport protein